MTKSLTSIRSKILTNQRGKIMNIIFMGSPDFATPTLAKIINSEHNLLSVYSQPPRPSGRGQKVNPTPVHKLAAENSISVFTPEKLTTDEVEKILAQKPDVIVVVAYGLLLPKKLVESAPCINLHPSALPKWRGAAPMNYPILHGEKTTDICIMKMEKGLDTGPVYLRKPYNIGEDETAGELHDRFKHEGAKWMLEVLNNWESYKNSALPQVGESTYAHKFKAEDLTQLRKLDFSEPAEELHNQIRGLSPWPGATFTHKDNEIKALKSSVSKKSEPKRKQGEYEEKIGEIVSLDNEGIHIQTNDGVLILKNCQRAGKKAMPTSEMLKGYEMTIEDILS